MRAVATALRPPTADAGQAATKSTKPTNLQIMNGVAGVITECHFIKSFIRSSKAKSIWRDASLRCRALESSALATQLSMTQMATAPLSSIRLAFVLFFVDFVLELVVDDVAWRGESMRRSFLAAEPRRFGSGLACKCDCHQVVRV